MPHMYNHTDNYRQQTKPTKKGMKRVSPKANPKNPQAKQKKPKPMGKAKKTISY